MLRLFGPVKWSIPKQGPKLALPKRSPWFGGVPRIGLSPTVCKNFVTARRVLSQIASLLSLDVAHFPANRCHTSTVGSCRSGIWLQETLRQTQNPGLAAARHQLWGADYPVTETHPATAGQTKPERASEPQFGCRVIAKQRTVPDVLAQGVEGFMAGLAHDGHLGDTVQERLGREARPQTVPGIQGGI